MRQKVVVNMVSINQETEEDPHPAPPEFEEGGQATVDELREVNLGTEEDPRPTYISAAMPEEEAQEYIAFLKEHRDVFVWTYDEMPGLDPKVAVHKLSVGHGKRPVKQPQRRMRPELIA